MSEHLSPLFLLLNDWAQEHCVNLQDVSLQVNHGVPLLLLAS
uniref:Uncharacterized protein n=1 Tax=Arundo donax TaxID=35708 RepID=A0A0A9BW63_ARUDO